MIIPGTNVDVTGEVLPLLQALQNTGDPRILEALGKFQRGELGTSFNRASFLGNLEAVLPGGQALAESLQASNLDSMSDDELLAMASRRGIDTSQFRVAPSPVLQEMGRVPNIPAASFTDLSKLEDLGLTPEAQGVVARIFQGQRELGQREIERSALEASGRRGLRMTDTPIAAPFTRSLADLESGLRGAEAKTLIDLGLGNRQFGETSNLARLNLGANITGQRAGFLEGQRQFEGQLGQARTTQQQQFLLAMKQLQESLKENATQNRLRLANMLGEGALNLGSSRLKFDTGAAKSSSNPLSLLAPSTGLDLFSGGVKNVAGLFG